MNEVLRAIYVGGTEETAGRVRNALNGSGLSIAWTGADPVETLPNELVARPELILCGVDSRQHDLARLERLAGALGSRVPIIAVPSNADEVTAVEAMRAGAVDCVALSRLDELGEAVTRALRERGGRDAANQRQMGAEALLMLAMSQLPAIVWTLDRDLCFTRTVGAGLEKLGLAADELVGRSLREFFDEEAGLPAMLDAHESALAGQRVRYEVTLAARTYECVAQPLRLGGEIRGVAGVALDVTDRREVLARVVAAQRLESIGQLAGGIAHDFNNALTVISNYTGFLLEQFRGDAEVYEDLSVVRDAAERAARLTHQLLAFSRRQILEPEPLDVNDVVIEIERLMRRLLGEDVELVLDLDPVVGTVLADWVQLQHVVLNLAINARDAMPRGGRLTIETEAVSWPGSQVVDLPSVPEGRYARLRVRDTGPGMPPEVVERIFEPFFTIRGQEQGSGLGLATAYGIVRQSEGYIWAESEVGRGTVFTILLPEHMGARDGFGQRRPSKVAALGGTETVLLVEDDHSVRRATRRALEAGGYEVIEAGLPEEALALGRERGDEIDLLVSDVVMPQMDGVELSARLTALFPNLRVLLVSGYADSHLADRQSTANSPAFLQKPFAPQMLLRRVRQILDE